jgi:CheY-like chemotaxis protein
MRNPVNNEGIAMTDLSHIRRVLIVEDDGIIALDIETTLLAAGAGEVTALASVEGALRAVDEVSFDAAVVDLHLGAAGWTYDVAARLKTKGVPFVLSSGTIEVAEGFRDVPMVMKPYSSDQLVAALVIATTPRSATAAE